jgi:hypothetical protein
MRQASSGSVLAIPSHTLAVCRGVGSIKEVILYGIPLSLKCVLQREMQDLIAFQALFLPARLRKKQLLG